MSYEEHMGAVQAAITKIDDVQGVIATIRTSCEQVNAAVNTLREICQETTGLVVNAVGESPNNENAANALTWINQLGNEKAEEVDKRVHALRGDKMDELARQASNIQEALTQYQAVL